MIYVYYLNCLEWETGFEQKLTSYCVCCCTENAVNDKAYSSSVSLCTNEWQKLLQQQFETRSWGMIQTLKSSTSLILIRGFNLIYSLKLWNSHLSTSLPVSLHTWALNAICTPWKMYLSISNVLFFSIKTFLILRENDKHCTRRSKSDTDL